MKTTRLSEFFQNAPEAYALFGHPPQGGDSWTFIAANAVFESLVGTSTATWTGNALHALIPYDAATDSGIRTDAWLSAIRQAAGPTGHGTIDFKVPGRSAWMRATIFHAGPGRLGAAFHDITSEMMKGQEIEAFFTLNLDMFCVLDEKLLILRTNRAFGVEIGYPPEAIAGKCLCDLVHKEDREPTRRHIEGVMTGRPAVGFVNRCRHHDGTWRSIEWHILGGSGGHIFASARDITAFRELERILTDQTTRLQQKVSQLETLSMTDELTGLFNRHYFDVRIEEETERSDRYNDPLAMAILDLDRFKHVNDTFGHPAGDEVLRHTAGTLRGAVRRTDVVVRFGGEEFVVLMPQTTLDAAHAVAEKIRLAVEAEPHPTVGHVTGSLGVSERTRGESFKRWYRRTDDALYKAKATGRNRVVAAEDHEENGIDAVRMEWRHDWETGHPEIDRQHRALIEIANNLIRITLSTPDRHRLAGQFGQLIQHILQHFLYKERILELTGYPDAAQHAHIHRELAKKASHLQTIFQNGEITGTALFSFMVDDVILGHMTVADMKYVDWIHAHASTGQL